MTAQPGTGGTQPGAPPLPAATVRLVRTLWLAMLLEWAGAGAMLPLLPLYVRRQGGSDAVVGAVMAAYFVGAFVFQYGAGRVSDRVGRLPVLLGGLAVYALGALLFLVPGPAGLDVVFRGLQGAGAGASGVAALAMIAHAVPLSHRGRATAGVYGAELGGLAVGPVLGSIAGLGAMHWLFVAAACASIVAMIPVVMVGAARRGPGPQPAGPPSDQHVPRARLGRPLAGALVAGLLIGATSGVYEACWSLLMTRHGANQWEIGISWTLFALPFAAMTRPAGWLADHLDRRWLVAGSLAWSVGFCATYPFLPGFVPLMVLSVWESIGFSLALPACQSILGQDAEPSAHGRAQGMFAASQTGATALAAACAGALFGLAPWMPFVSVAGVCAVMVAAIVVIWRPVPGRVAPSLVGGPGVAGAERSPLAPPAL